MSKFSSLWVSTSKLKSSWLSSLLRSPHSSLSLSSSYKSQRIHYPLLVFFQSRGFAYHSRSSFPSLSPSFLASASRTPFFFADYSSFSFYPCSYSYDNSPPFSTFRSSFSSVSSSYLSEKNILNHQIDRNNSREEVIPLAFPEEETYASEEEKEGEQEGFVELKGFKGWKNYYGKLATSFDVLEVEDQNKKNDLTRVTTVYGYENISNQRENEWIEFFPPPPPCSPLRTLSFPPSPTVECTQSNGSCTSSALFGYVLSGEILLEEEEVTKKHNEFQIASGEKVDGIEIEMDNVQNQDKFHTGNNNHKNRIARHVHRTRTVREGEYFVLPVSNTRIRFKLMEANNTRVSFIHSTDFLPLRTLGGPLEAKGRLKYIDGCSDTLLLPPPKRGDPCLNYLHFPRQTSQTLHYHPTTRVGIISKGVGICTYQNNVDNETDDDSIKNIDPNANNERGRKDDKEKFHHAFLSNDMIFIIPPKCKHSFHTYSADQLESLQLQWDADEHTYKNENGKKERGENWEENFLTKLGLEDLNVVAYHPDTDVGPIDEDHPMLNRTFNIHTESKFENSQHPTNVLTY